MTDEQIIERFKSMPERELGRVGEKICQNVFKASGVYYSPLKDINNGGAPMAVSGNGKIVLPDFDCACETWTAYIDAKAKRRPIRFRKANQLRHGIDTPNYLAYRKASTVYQKQAGILVVELFDEDIKEWSGRLLVESFKGLGEPVSGMEGTWGSDKVFWPEKFFEVLDRMPPHELVAVHEGRCDSYRAMLDQVFDRKIQGNLF